MRGNGTSMRSRAFPRRWNSGSGGAKSLWHFLFSGEARRALLEVSLEGCHRGP